MCEAGVSAVLQELHYFPVVSSAPRFTLTQVWKLLRQITQNTAAQVFLSVSCFSINSLLIQARLKVLVSYSNKLRKIATKAEKSIF